MKTHVRFQSGKFPPYEYEDEQINPSCFGKRLAEFLAQRLPGQGIEVEDLIAEDWGWIVPIRNPAFRLWVGVANMDGFEDQFLGFIEPHKPSVRRFFRKIDTTERVGALQGAMDKILLSDPGIKNVNWSTYDEFTSSIRGR